MSTRIVPYRREPAGGPTTPGPVDGVVKRGPMASDDSTRAVVTALGANLAIGAAKFVAAAITGSASMLAEGVHSVADSANQLLLLIGGRRAPPPGAALHPVGHAPQHEL